MKEKLVRSAAHLFKRLEEMELDERVEAINELRAELREYSPFKSEPVDCVRWVKSPLVMANDYNPNSVAPTEMKLLEHSITEDGYTQPIVSWVNDGKYEVIDGFHRHRVGKESPVIQARVQGYLPLVVVNESRLNLGDRMASTIRCNSMAHPLRRMNNRNNRTCASCRHFPLSEAMDTGKAQCEAYGHETAWSEHFCVLYNRATDVAARRPLVLKLCKYKENKHADYIPS